MAEDEEVAPARNVRGRNKLSFLGRNEGKLPVSFLNGAPVEDNSTNFSALVGRLGRDANLLPLDCVKWPNLDVQYKDRVMLEIKQHFDFPDECDKFVLMMLNKAWKDQKGDLKLKYFKPLNTPEYTTEDRLANCPPDVPEDQWEVLVRYWEDPIVDKIAVKNTKNRNHHQLMYAGGSKNLSKHAIEIEKDPNRDAPQGKPATRMEIFKKVHTKKDKTPTSDLAKNKMDQMKEKMDEAIEKGLDIYSIGPGDIYSKVMGPDTRGRRRCFGRGTFPGESSNNTSKRDNIEVTTLKRKVVDVEEELQSTKQQYSDLKNTTTQLQTELTQLKALIQLFLANGNPLFPTQTPGGFTTASPSSGTLPRTQVQRGSSSSSPSTTRD